ncbi:HAD-IIA family hydrolase [Desulfuromonas sp. TF]|uniref:HAD-IIA family hydrolase n=1 Tax=Desulfuromonas sp. TF TaxID=1232410 RepID=UPI00040BCD82|nr:HAD hydrolase-like protein [Desulfuromonas sp. TF]
MELLMVADAKGEKMFDALANPYSGKFPLQRLQEIQGFVIDVDGTLVLGNRNNHGFHPLPGAIELIRFLGGRRLPFVLFTNGTARTPEQYIAALRTVGFDLQDNSILTPASCAADLFLRRGYRRVMALGGDGLKLPLQEVGLELVPPKGRAQVDAVLAGWHPEFTMCELEAACHAIWDGAKMFSVSQTRFFATADGRGIAPSRAMSAMIKDMTGCRVMTVGKPSLHALRHAGRRLEVKLKDLAIVGDDPEMEVPMAHSGGSLAIAVNSGLATIEAFMHLPEKRRPHLHLDGVDEVLKLYANSEKGAMDLTV